MIATFATSRAVLVIQRFTLTSEASQLFCLVEMSLFYITPRSLQVTLVPQSLHKRWLNDTKHIQLHGALHSQGAYYIK